MKYIHGQQEATTWRASPSSLTFLSPTCPYMRVVKTLLAIILTYIDTQEMKTEDPLTSVTDEALRRSSSILYFFRVQNTYQNTILNCMKVQ